MFVVLQVLGDLLTWWTLNQRRSSLAKKTVRPFPRPLYVMLRMRKGVCLRCFFSNINVAVQGGSGNVECFTNLINGIGFVIVE